MMRASFVCSLATVAIFAVGSQATAAINGGLELFDSKRQRDFEGYLPSELEITDPDKPFNFAGQAYGLLETIEELSITLTVWDGDTGGTDDFDHDHWTLGLDDIDTGLKLNGFRDGQTDTRTLTQISVETQAQILEALRYDGLLGATIIDDTSSPQNWIALCDDPHKTWLTLKGSPIPEPSTMVIWSLLGASVAGLAWWRSRRAA